MYSLIVMMMMMMMVMMMMMMMIMMIMMMTVITTTTINISLCQWKREIWQSSISSMLSGSEARNTGLPITAHVRTFCCGFVEKKTWISIVFLKRFFW